MDQGNRAAEKVKALPSRGSGEGQGDTVKAGVRRSAKEFEMAGHEDREAHQGEDCQGAEAGGGQTRNTDCACEFGFHMWCCAKVGLAFVDVVWVVLWFLRFVF